jgi:prepilin-type N-terminal cleavage/methylation domain-containing protein
MVYEVKKKMLKNKPSIQSHDLGFTVVELLVVILVAGVCLAFAGPLITSSLKVIQVDTAMHTVAQQMVWARELAISNRRNYKISFDHANLAILITKLATSTEAAQQQSRIPLPNTISLTRYGSTPYPEGISTELSEAYFTADGTGTDSTGQLLSGVVYLTRSDHYDQNYNRAVTILGGTGKVATFRYNGDAHVWAQ